MGNAATQTQGKSGHHSPTDGNVARTHDEFYVNDNPNQPPKDSFKIVGNIIKEYKNSKQSTISIVDIGCAAGAFPHYVGSLLPSDHIEGLEVLPSLIEAAKKIYPNVTIKQGSVLDRNAFAAQSFDVVCLLGVLSIFDDVEPALSNLVHWTKPGGKVIIHGMFNPYDIDVFVKYRHSNDYGEDKFESGWNVVSQKTVSVALKKFGASKVTFHKFDISVDLEKQLDDPVRSWTEKAIDNTRQITNGLCLKQPQFILEADI